jgi:2-polyprenyl-3-methyl-5-hydroxy-6-metoxy-1,4-benzoquinol methylase
MAKDIHTRQARSHTSQGLKPFVDFYNKHNVIPVGQDISDLDNFVFRRNFLYARLGAPLRQFHDRRVIEFGPGGGFNAVATSLHQPELYVFVDATQASLVELDKKRNDNQFRAKNIEIIDSNIFDYSDDRKFDYVIIEGTICGQAEPERMLRHASGFVNKGGILISTTISATSVLSEICRRLLRIKISETIEGFDPQVRFASKIFDSHLKSLGTSTRPTADWVIDMIFHDWHNEKYIFSMIDSAAAIEDEFDFYRSLPCFLTDDRWYKKVTRTSQSANELLAEQYPALAGCLIDYRISLNSVLKISHQLGNLESLSKLACEVHDTIINENSYRKLDEFFRILMEIRRSLPIEFAPTIAAIDDFVTSLPRFIDNSDNVGFIDFKSWWGRGQQYVSFIRAA